MEIETLEEAIIKDFNEFITKWCGTSAPHLLDSDDNDGEDFRSKLREFASRDLPVPKK